ncbi:hypothetical protein [Botrimarina sp.]|uniref:hypothetical protein n=1 Tax=Botrimarina sp. TaxID=2795802 RepID=UPI0032EC0D1B
MSTSLNGRDDYHDDDQAEGFPEPDSALSHYVAEFGSSKAREALYQLHDAGLDPCGLSEGRALVAWDLEHAYLRPLRIRDVERFWLVMRDIGGTVAEWRAALRELRASAIQLERELEAVRREVGDSKEVSRAS